MDLWARQPMQFLDEALFEGYRGFTWHIGYVMAKRVDPLAKVRMRALPYGEDVRVMLIDYAGAPEYSLFSRYDKPLAVYPTWSEDEGKKAFEKLVMFPVGENEELCNDKSIRPEHRPVFGQKHRVVVHRIDKVDTELLIYLADLQKIFTECEIFISGLTSFDHLFTWGFQAADFRPTCFAGYQILPNVTLPSGKTLVHTANRRQQTFDPRYADWFDLIGITQAELLEALVKKERGLFARFSLRSARWAQKNYKLVEPFVIDRKPKRREKAIHEHGLVDVSNDAFVLPAARRRVMRNIGMAPTELDKFMCDTCILQNACTLYREGAVCGLKGSDGVALSDSFGTRSADQIIDGLSKLLERQAERVEDALAEEKAAGETNKDVTRQMNSLFSNGVKLAKLIDPSLAGGPKVQVNVGVGAGGSAAIVANADPRQLTAQIVRELESQGIPREQINGEMIAGYFESLGLGTTKKQAIGAAKVVAEESKTIEGEVA